MNKKIKEYFEKKGFTFNGNQCYGFYNNFETNVILQLLDNTSPLKIHFSCFLSETDRTEVRTKIQSKNQKFLRFEFTPYGLLIGLNDFTIGSLMKKLDATLEFITNVLKENNAKEKEYCPSCGASLDLYKVECNVNGMKITLDEHCKKEINKEIEEDNRNFDNLPNNYLKGFMGALIGAFAGFLLAFGLYMVGFVSALSAFVGVILGTFLYKKMGGKQNKVMVMIVSVTVFTAMIGAVFAIYLYQCALLAQEAGMDYSALEIFKLAMKEPEFSTSFYTDLGMMILFTILGAGYQISAMLKSTKRIKNI